MKTHISPVRRVEAIVEALQVLQRMSVQPLARPVPPASMESATQLAREAGVSASVVAQAIAALGRSSDSQHAKTIWQETLAQIERVQRLHNLPPIVGPWLPSAD